MTLEQRLILHEGIRTRPYKDTEGIWTIGCGRNMEGNGFSPEESRMIFNRPHVTLEQALQFFDNNPLTAPHIKILLSNDIAKTRKALARALPDLFPHLSPLRQEVLVDMGFMGVAKLLGFQEMIAALKVGDFERAAREMLESKWARQVGKRALRLARIMETDSEENSAI